MFEALNEGIGIELIIIEMLKFDSGNCFMFDLLYIVEQPIEKFESVRDILPMYYRE